MGIFCRIILLAFLCLSLRATGQPPAALRFDNLGIADGLSQSTVSYILQDHPGFMWFCTDDGINRYDGYRFKIFRNEKGNAASPVSNQANCLHEDSSGNLWAISSNGISRYLRDSESFRQIPFKERLSCSHPITTAETGGTVLFTDHGYLYRIHTQTGAWTRERIPGCTDAFILTSFPNGTLLLRDGQSLLLYHPMTRRKRKLPFNFPLDHTDRAVVIKAGSVWLMGKGRLVRYDTGSGLADKYLPLPGYAPSVGAFDSKGFLWLGTNTALLCVDTAFLQYRAFNATTNPYALAGTDIISLYKDRSGILWIGTNDGGLSKLSYNKFKFASLGNNAARERGLPGKAALALEEDADRNIWLGTESGNIAIFNPATKALTRCDNSTGCRLRTDSYILSLFYANGIMYCGHNNGVDAISPATHKVIATPLVEENTAVKKVLRDRNGDLWALGGTRLYKYDRHKAVFLPVFLPRYDGRLQNIVEDDRHYFWIGVSEGLLCYDPATGTTRDYGRKFPDLFARGSSMALCRDAQGHIWIGASDVGLLRYEPATDRFTLYHLAGLPNKTIYTLLSDTTGCLWLSTNAGVSRFDPRTRQFTNFNAADGLLSNEGIGRAAMRDSRGQLWFGNIAGVNIIDPGKIPVNTTAPVPRITGFKVFDKDIAFGDMLRRQGGIRLRQADNYFTIEYSAMDYTQPSDNSYRIMLEGFDKGWRVLNTANNVSYTNLDGGRYTFRLMAYNSDGTPAATSLALPIYITPHFYRTWWFFTLMTILIAGMAYTFYRYRINALKKELRLRTNIAADLHDDVGATLSSIKMLATMLRPRLAMQEELGKAIDTIHQRAGTTLEAMSDIVWSINPRNDAADNLVMRMKTYASEVLDDTDTDYHFQVAEGMKKLKLSQRKRKEIYLIFKEALNNALKYAGATGITITAGRSGRRLELSIADNGRGFDADQLKPSTRGGNGLVNMQQRAAEIGGVFRIHSSPGQGTTITLSVPVP